MLNQGFLRVINSDSNVAIQKLAKTNMSTEDMNARKHNTHTNQQIELNAKPVNVQRIQQELNQVES